MKKQSSLSGSHLVRFGTAGDQEFLLGEFLSTYDDLIINAGILAYMRGALATFLSIKAKNKPYFIDPQTHAFQHDIANITAKSGMRSGKVKLSLQKLIDVYGEPVLSSVVKQSRPLEPADFRNKKILSDFCKRVLTFQMRAISDEINKSDATPYYQYSNIKTQSIFTPLMLVAPYFFLRPSNVAQWLDINIKCANASKSISKKFNKKLALQITISQDLLTSPSNLRTLVNAYSSTRPDYFLIWVDSLVEQEANQKTLEAFIHFLQHLGRVAPVINLYGSYFSVALGKSGIIKNLIGVAHSLEYGETRGVVPVGGGFPTAKFYFPSLHARLLYRDAFRAIRIVEGNKNVGSYFKKVCDCKQCRAVIRTDPEVDFAKYGITGNTKSGKSYPLPETKKLTVSHYMWSKHKEYRQPMTKQNILDTLDDTIQIFANHSKSISVEHCRTWSRIIQGL